MHKIVVFSYGDKNGNPYKQFTEKDKTTNIRSTIDHIDMNHFNNCVDNLQLVSYNINLYRAAKRFHNSQCGDRLAENMKSMSNEEKIDALVDIQLDDLGAY